jgi:hypothetical protein
MSPAVYFSKDTTAAPATTIPGALVRYTLDGSEPDSTYPIVQQPIRITTKCTLTARVFLAGGRSGISSVTSYVKIDPDRNGVRYSYYEGNWSALPDFSSMMPVRTGMIHDISLVEMGRRANCYGAVFESRISISVEGLYTFSVMSGDGSK